MAIGDLSFGFNPEKGETPESIAKRRRLAEALMAKNTTAPSNVGEGLNSIGNALLYRKMMGGVKEAEKDGRSSAADAFSGLFGSGSPGVSDADRAYSIGDGTPSAGESDYATERVSDAHGNFSGDQEEFVQALMPAAVKASQQTGVDPRIIVAQAAQETGWGKSAPGNNYFGIKSHGQEGGQNLNTHEYVDGERVNVTDSFRSFESPEDSVMGYAQFIQENPRYQPFMQAEGLDAQLAALQESGYATDPNYASSVGAIARSLPMPETAREEVQVASLDPSAGVQQATANYSAGDQITTTDRGQRVVDTLLGPNISGGDALGMQQGGNAPMPAPGAAQGPVNLPTSGPILPNRPPHTAAQSPQQRVAMAMTGQSGEGPQAVQRPNSATSFTPESIGLPETAQEGVVMRGSDGQVYQYAQLNGEVGGNGEWGWIRANPAVVGQPSNTGGAQAGQRSGQRQGPGMQQIMAVLNNPWASDSQKAVATAMFERHIQQQDPKRQLEMERARLELDELRNPAPEMTDDMREYEFARQQGYEGSFQDFTQGAESSASTERIGRLTDNLMATGDFMDPQEARNIAVGIVDGRFKTDRHPVTGELQIVDMATGQPIYGGRRQQAQAAQPQGGTLPTPEEPMATDEQFGQQFPSAPESFGVGGSIARGVNTISDAVGAGPVYPEIQQTQSDFGVLRESLMSDMASAYNRQPPSWLMREIRSLTPAAGSPLEGAAGAQSKLNAIGRHLANEMEATDQALQRELSPKNRQELEARRAGLQTGIHRITTALDAFGGTDADAGQLPEGVTEEDIQFTMERHGLTREEVLERINAR